MTYLRKRLAVVALIIITILTGVLLYEKSDLQAGASERHDLRNWYPGSRSNEPTTEVSHQKGSAGRTDTVGENDRGSAAELATGSAETSKPPTNVEAGYPSVSLGAGCVTDITVRPGYRYYTADELEKGLLYDLKPLAHYFIQAQEKYGIDAVFLAAVSAEESGWGRYQFRDNNIFGFENCDYDSLEACVDGAASWLYTEYLTPGGRYYEGVGVADINKHYNGRDTWEEHVTDIMGQIVERIESEV